MAGRCILIPMTMRKMIIPAAAALLVSLMPHIAEAASAPKVRKYSATMAKAHLPTAPNKGTDDYRCFLLDPKVKEDSIIRSIEFIPQRKNYVHHAIIFRVTDADIAEAIAADKSGIGWPCFGGTSLGGMMSTFITSPWISSWAPGRGKDIAPKDMEPPLKRENDLSYRFITTCLQQQIEKLKLINLRFLWKLCPQKVQKLSN